MISLADYMCIMFILSSIIALIYRRIINVHTVMNIGNAAVNQACMSPTSSCHEFMLSLVLEQPSIGGCSDFKIRSKLTSTFPPALVCTTTVLITSKLHLQFQCEELIVQKMCTLNIPMQDGARQLMATPYYKPSTENKMS
jgi:hypothetical protein